MRILPLDPALTRHLRAGGPDANGQPAERHRSNGSGAPCRSCLQDIAAGEEMLICALCPFPAMQPYAETGPIFLHAADCPPWDADGLPPIFTTSPDYLIKGYTQDHRIRYGTGAVVPAATLAQDIAARLAQPEVAFVDIRSSRNNCFQARAVSES